MKTLNPPTALSEPRSELQMFDRWNSDALRALINRKTEEGAKPSYLFLGRTEANLLRQHLGTAFGTDSTKSLTNLFYMGLSVVEVEAESYLRTARAKRVEGLQEALNRFPTHYDLEASSFWVDALV